MTEPKRSPLDQELVAKEKRVQLALRLTTLNPIPIVRPCPVRSVPEQPGDARPVAWADVCPRCGARAVHGCDHFRPVGERT